MMAVGKFDDDMVGVVAGIGRGGDEIPLGRTPPGREEIGRLRGGFEGRRRSDGNDGWIYGLASHEHDGHDEHFLYQGRAAQDE